MQGISKTWYFAFLVLFVANLIANLGCEQASRRLIRDTCGNEADWH
jgi:hypothetical protein